MQIRLFRCTYELVAQPQTRNSHCPIRTVFNRGPVHPIRCNLMTQQLKTLKITKDMEYILNNIICNFYFKNRAKGIFCCICCSLCVKKTFRIFFLWKWTFNLPHCRNDIRVYENSFSQFQDMESIFLLLNIGISIAIRGTFPVRMTKDAK